MTINQDNLGGALRVLADGDDGAPPPVERLMRRGQQARRRRAVGVSAAALGVATVLGVGAIGVTAETGNPSGATVQAADLRLAAAAAATQRETFELRVTTRRENRTWVREGAYDPTARAGYLSWTDDHGNPHEQRVIGDDVYVKLTIDGKRNQWRKMTGGAGFRMTDLGDGGAPAMSVDPTEVLAALRDNGTVKELGGSRYSFAFRGETTGGRTVTGTVAVGSGKVSKVSYDVGGAALVLEFFDYGTAVRVERPA
ncbi:hypothetical protein WEI85_05010 [Actinomycetes bacterium KLBMP 9797]